MLLSYLCIAFNGKNFTAPVNIGNFTLGTVLTLTASASGFDALTMNFTVDNPANTTTRQITFILSKALV